MTADRPYPRRRHGRRRARRLLAVTLLVLAALAAASAALAVNRYLPALDQARALRAQVTALVADARHAGPDMDATQVAALRRDLASARDGVERLASLLSDDPLVAAARALPPTSGQVRGTDRVVAAGRDLLDAADAALALADRFVQIRASATPDAGGGTGALAAVVELLATGGPETDAILAGLERAEAELAAAGDTLPDPVAQVRDLVRDELDALAPAIRGLSLVRGVLPDVLGWDGPRTYLVLTQDPAELRPTGGFIGSFGIVTFDRGRLAAWRFQDVALLDYPVTRYPFVAPPEPLLKYLLGPTQGWQLADSNWSADFPTAAQQAVALYRNEGGTERLDGVLAMTTQTIDELLAVTGPVSVPSSGVTIASGETTLKVLQATRVAAATGGGRKAFLSALADRLFAALQALPPTRWLDLAARGDSLAGRRLVQAWLVDPRAQAVVARLGFDGGVRQGPGDFVYPVDANLAPTSKLDLVTRRELALTVSLDPLGNATDRLEMAWTNEASAGGALPAAYRALPVEGTRTTLGRFTRVLVPDRSRLMTVSGGSTLALTAPSDTGTDAGRAWFGNYLRVLPGTARLAYTWVSPYAAGEEDGDPPGTFTYRLTVQAQPGAPATPLALRVELPAGAVVLAASPGLAIAGSVLTAATTLERDVTLVVRYRP